MRRALILGLLAVNVGVVLLTVSWAQGLLQENTGTQTVQAQNPITGLGGQNPQPAATALARYAAAPLFRKDRAFAAPPQTPVTATASTTSPPEAVGTILSSDTDKWVLLVHPETQALQKVALGERFAGWDVTDISETSVQLTRSDTVLTKAIRP